MMPFNPDTTMKDKFSRRQFVGVSATAALAGSLAATAAQPAEGQGKQLKILGISCSPRKGMATARNTGLRVAQFASQLAAARPIK